MQKPFLSSLARMTLALGAWLFACTSRAADWPQFLGPHRNGTSPEKGLLRSWPAQGPAVLWSVAVGRGFGGPAIKDKKVYLLDRNDEGEESLRCLDLLTGRELWRFSYSAPGRVMFPGSRSVPTVDDERVYSCGHNGDLYSLSLTTRQPLWHVNIWTDFGGKPPRPTGSGFGPREEGEFPIWAITQCPLLYGDLVIVASQAPRAGVVAYDKRTGEVKWKTPSLGYVGYVSPTVVKVDGEDHIAMVTPSTNPFRRSSPDENRLGKVVGIHPHSGQVLWEYDKWNCHITVAPAVDAGENRVLVVGGYELGATMIQVTRQADGRYTTRELFTTDDFGDQTKPPLLHQGHFYAQYGTNQRRDGLVCMNLEGQVLWKTRRAPDFNKGSMILVDGLILATDGGRLLYLIEPDPAGFRPLASAQLLAEEGGDSEGVAGRVGGSAQNWAPIALSDGKLLVRDQRTLKCVKVTE